MTSSASPRTAVLAAVIVVPIAAACSGEGVIAPSDATRLLAAAAEQAKTWQPTERVPVTLRVEGPAVVRNGAVVPVRVTLHNETERPLAIGFERTQGFDVVVTRAVVPADSGPVWSPMKLPDTVGGDVAIT